MEEVSIFCKTHSSPSAESFQYDLLTLARKPCFATFAGAGGAILPGVSKRSVVELRRKKQQIALAEYSRLVVLFLVLTLALLRGAQRLG